MCLKYIQNPEYMAPYSTKLALVLNDVRSFSILFDKGIPCTSLEVSIIQNEIHKDLKRQYLSQIRFSFSAYRQGAVNESGLCSGVVV